MDFSSIHSLFTPSVLFVLLNVVIGTIAVISSRRHHRTSHGGGGGGGGDHQPQETPIARSSSSSALERVRSFGLFRFRSGDLPPVNDDHDDLDNCTMDQNHHQQPQQQEPQFRRIQSESDSKKKKKKKKDGEGAPPTMKNKMKKSASEKVEIMKRPPVTVDEEVDAKADDFINKFRQQLNLQRLDSLLRGTKEMITAKRN